MRYFKGLVGFVSMILVTPFVVGYQFLISVVATLVTPFTAARLCYFYNRWPWESLAKAQREYKEKRMQAVYDSILEELSGSQANN